MFGRVVSVSSSTGARVKAGGKRASLAQLRKEKEIARNVSLLSDFHRQEGHWVVPFKTEMLGVPLGKVLAAYGRRLVQGNVEDETLLKPLRAIGFPVDSWRQYVWQTATIPALETYKRMHGDLLVPGKYVVPYGQAPWPRPTWNYCLGSKVHNLRNNRDRLTPEEEQTLVRMGFVWNVLDAKWHNQVLPALREYKSRFGHVNVPQDFMIGKADVSWPQQLRGIKLGVTVRDIRTRDQFSRVAGSRDQLKALGFSWNLVNTRWKECILPALETFHKLHGHSNVPQRFVVPSEAPWPPSTWELKLGNVVINIRSRSFLKDQIAEDQERWRRLNFQMRTQKPKDQSDV